MSGQLGEVLAVVPARGGSRRLPGKNLRELGGKPLLAWTLDAALGASTIDRVVVSTEDAAIAGCARQFGAEVPVARPSELARDETPGIDPILHIVEWLADHESYTPAIVAVLQPTSPLRTAADIDACLERMAANGAQAIVSVSPAPFPLAWLRLIDADGTVRRAIDTGDEREAYVINGAIYATTYGNLVATRSTYAERTSAYVMPRDRGVDIDTREDFALAECLLRARTAS